MEKAILSLSIILSLTFIFTGSLKLFLPNSKLEKVGVKGLDFMSPIGIKILGMAELIGALVLLLSTVIPISVEFIRVVLIGFSLLMIAASIHHLRRKEYKNINITLFICLACLFILILK